MARTKEFDTEEVLEKAIGLFWDKGYSACSMQDVVEGLGLSRSSIYETFGDKHQLFLAALKKYQQEGAEGMRHSLGTTTDIRQTLKEMFYAVLPAEPNTTGTNAGSANACSQKGCFMVSAGIELAPHDPEIAAIVQANAMEIEETLHVAIQRGQDTGHLSKNLDALSLARFIFATLSGLRVSAASSTADRTKLEDIIKVALSVL
jgi:TetR/AcrR family transcriptional regulator, transcriptional repressor for nem operon